MGPTGRSRLQSRTPHGLVYGASLRYTLGPRRGSSGAANAPCSRALALFERPGSMRKPLCACERCTVGAPAIGSLRARTQAAAGSVPHARAACRVPRLQVAEVLGAAQALHTLTPSRGATDPAGLVYSIASASRAMNALILTCHGARLVLGVVCAVTALAPTSTADRPSQCRTAYAPRAGLPWGPQKAGGRACLAHACMRRERQPRHAPWKRGWHPGSSSEA